MKLVEVSMNEKELLQHNIDKLKQNSIIYESELTKLSESNQQLTESREDFFELENEEYIS